MTKKYDDFKTREDYLEWYRRPATPKQIAYCESLGKYMEVFPSYSSRYHCQGDVSQWIDELKAGTYYLCERA
jgi:hypothetical protein